MVQLVRPDLDTDSRALRITFRALPAKDYDGRTGILWHHDDRYVDHASCCRIYLPRQLLK